MSAREPAPPTPPSAGEGTALASTRLAPVFAALGDPVRLKLIMALGAGGAFSIAQLTAGTDISRQGVTKHLHVLAEAGLVGDLKQGRERCWQLHPGAIDEARRTLELIGRQWDARLDRFKTLVETDPGSQ